MRRSLSHGSANALVNFEHLEQQLHVRTPVLFLDYDGTLTPIVRDPNKAFLPENRRQLLRDLSTRFPTGIVSGRSLSKVSSLVQVDELIYAGSHGFDIRGPGDLMLRHEVAKEFLPILEAVRDRLIDEVSGIPGVGVEDNRFSISVHYRNVDEDRQPEVGRIVDEVLTEFPQLKRGYGKKVFEVKPDIKWNKGQAVRWLLEALGLNGRQDIFPIYIGDDTTDEDAFEALRELQAQCSLEGLGILVHHEPKLTGASMILRDPDEVECFLVRILELKQSAPTTAVDMSGPDMRIAAR